MNPKTLLILAMSAIIATGCASVVAPGTNIPSNSPELIAKSDIGIQTGTPASEWWKIFHDSMLNTLVEEAVNNNREIRAALANVKAARSLADAASREGLPQGRLEGSAQRQRPSLSEVNPYREDLPRPPSSLVAMIGQGISWEIDLFGRVGTATAVAERRGDIALADLHAATALLQAEVVRQYFGLRLQQQLLQISSEEVQALDRRKMQQLARADAGLNDRREALATEALKAKAQSEHSHILAEMNAHLAALAVLTGRSPSERSTWRRALEMPASLPEPPSLESIQQPTDLLSRRPDVVRADAQLRAALGETVLTEREHLPRITLNLAYGLSAPFGKLSESSATRYSAGPVLSWHWLDAGRIQARAAAAKAGHEAALNQFEQTVLRALQDSELSLRYWASSKDALSEARLAESASAQAANFTKARASIGIDTPTVASEAVSTHLQAQRTVATLQRDSLAAYSQVQLALGAWQPKGQQEAEK